jgi:hypothetical protein
MKPPYYKKGIIEDNYDFKIKINNKEEIIKMRKSCKLAKDTLKYAKSLVKLGVLKIITIRLQQVN